MHKFCFVFFNFNLGNKICQRLETITFNVVLIWVSQILSGMCFALEKVKLHPYTEILTWNHNVVGREI